MTSPSLMKSKKKQPIVGKLMIINHSQEKQTLFWVDDISKELIEISEDYEVEMLVEIEPKYCSELVCINMDRSLCSGYIKQGARGISTGFLKKMQALE